MEIISFREIYQHITLSLILVVALTWSDAIKAKLSSMSLFKNINGLFLQAIVITVVIFAILILINFIIKNLQKEQDILVKKEEKLTK
tara:strand:- start:3389 stop:3649 length:261 start_codon:yes stop_codon:yes gene_type:complete